VEIAWTAAGVQSPTHAAAAAAAAAIPTFHQAAPVMLHQLVTLQYEAWMLLLLRLLLLLTTR
jgi:hypothetical protein